MRVQYIGGELSRQIKAQDGHYAEGAFLSNERVQSIAYRGADGSQVLSSLAGTDFHMALFRMRSRRPGTGDLGRQPASERPLSWGAQYVPFPPWACRNRFPHPPQAGGGGEVLEDSRSG